MKGLKVITILCAAALIAGCALPLGEDYLITRDGGDVSYIKDYNLQSYVPIPSSGDPPVTLVNQGGLEANVVWKDDAGEILLPFDSFLSGTVYQAEIRLRAKPGYGFYPSILFGYDEGKITSQNDGLGDSERTVQVIYNNSDDADITFITDYNLQNYVPIPAAGEVWSQPSRGDVTVEAAWGKKNGSNGFDPLPAGNVTFEEGAVYQAEIRLKVNAGYRFFTTRSFDYPVSKVSTPPLYDTDPEDRVLNVEYKATRTPAVIDDLNLTPYIPKPISGVMPLSSFAASQYTGKVIWKLTGTQTVQDGPFEESMEYTAEINLIPAIGYTFQGLGQNVFTHTGTGPGAVTNFPNSGAIGVAFPAAPGVGVIYDTDLTAHIYRPISGESPVRSIAGSQYTGTVTWVPAPYGTFQYDTEYTAVLNLHANPGYTFAGIGQNVFTHRDAPNAVTNLGGSGTVTIIFPATFSYTYKAIRSFGPVGAEGSALKMMEENKNENGLTIDLIEDTEEVIPNTVTLTAGETSPAKVIINGHNRVLSIQSLGTLLTVGRGVTLTLRNITLQGCAGNNAPLVTVQGGKLILGAGVTLMGNKSTGDAGGVWVNNGELALNEGVVIKEMEAQRGGGVLIDGYGKLSMNGGTIGGALPDGNAAAGENGGGGVLVLDGSFDMFGGTIQSNSASAQDSGGGVLVLNGSFNMYEGIIQSNRTLAPGSGGGVGILADGTLNLYNGTIKENSASAPGSGGGVGIAGGTLNLYNGTIKENSASAQSSAGGVGVFPDGTFNFYNGAIKGNRAEYNVPGPDVESGGAVFVLWDHYYGKYGNFIMYGGTIGGENSGDANTAAIGANAVWINGGGFDMAGGTITGNAGFNNYGVYIDRSFVIKGSARIDINDKVFLSNEYAEIYIEGALSASPAANIIHGAPVSGTTRLLAGSSNLLTENYRKFLYDGFDNRIIVEYDESLNRWYGIYHE